MKKSDARLKRRVRKVRSKKRAKPRDRGISLVRPFLHPLYPYVSSTLPVAPLEAPRPPAAPVEPPQAVKHPRHLRVARLGGLYWHHAVELRNGWIVHYTVDSSQIPPDAIRVTRINEFLNGGSRAEVVSHANAFPDDVVEARALSRVGEAKYDLWGNNCEHFATWAFTGESVSGQVESLREAIRDLTNLANLRRRGSW